MINFRCLAFAAAAAVMLVSCTKELGTIENGPVHGTKKVTLTATADVKTTLSSDRKYLDWVEGDSFNVFADVDGSIADPTFTGGSQEFVLEVPENATKLYTVYPAKSGNTKTEAKVTIPANQTQASAGVLNGNNCPMVGSGEINKDNTASIGFMPAFGLLAINVYSRDNSFDKKVTKVVVTPYSAEGTPATGFCGTATVDLTDDSDAPAFDGTAESVTVTLTEPYQVGYFETKTTADFGGEIYVALAPQVYYNFKVEVYTDDDYVYSAVLPTSEAYDFTEYDFASVSFNLANGNIKEINLNDYYSLYENGIDITICDRVINKNTHPDYQIVKTGDLTSSLFAENKILFIDNEDEENNVWSYTGILSTGKIGQEEVIIGRYKNKKQATLSFADTKMFRAIGSISLKNIRLETVGSTTHGLIQGSNGSGAEQGMNDWLLDACTLVNRNGAIYKFNSSTYKVPGSMKFNDCIIRTTSSVIENTVKSPVDLTQIKSIDMKQCVVAPYSESNEVVPLDASIINFIGTSEQAEKYYTNNLNINISYCSFYDITPQTGSNPAMIYVKTAGMLSMDHCVFYHSNPDKLNKIWTGYSENKGSTIPGGISVSATYANNSSDKFPQSNGNKSYWAPDDTGRTWSVTITTAEQVFDVVVPISDYFHAKVVKADGTTPAGGASYNKKYWVKVPATE